MTPSLATKAVVKAGNMVSDSWLSFWRLRSRKLNGLISIDRSKLRKLRQLRTSILRGRHGPCLNPTPTKNPSHPEWGML